jgi:hypothetical protein
MSAAAAWRRHGRYSAAVFATEVKLATAAEGLASPLDHQPAYDGV